MAIDPKTGQGRADLTEREQQEAIATLNTMRHFECAMLISAVKEGACENFILGFFGWPGSDIDRAIRLRQFILTNTAD